MPSSPVTDTIRLGALIIPILVLFVAGQALHFDPNRRLRRPSKAREAISRYEQPWGVFLYLLRVLLVLLILLDLIEITLIGTNQRDLLTYLPAWAIFQNPNLEVIYALLAYFALEMVDRLKRMSMNTFDFAFETHLDFEDWRMVDVERDSRPTLLLGKWRYYMKWWFKTDLELIDVVQMRMLIDCPDFETFKYRILHDDYPPRFAKILNTSPWGKFLGTIRELMRVDVIERIFHSPSLWEIWRKEINPMTGKRYTEEEMATTLYAELRGLLVCPQCQALPAQLADCRMCFGSGARMGHCTECLGKGVDEHEQQCSHCGGLGLNHRPIPFAFLNRLQYLWMARNVDYLRKTFHVWLANRTYVVIFGSSALIFLAVSLFLQSNFNVDLLVEAVLFGGAALIGSLGAAIVIIFGSAFNSSGTLASPYPLRYAKFGNPIWVQLRNIISWLTFSMLLIDTTFVMSQFLFEHHSNTVMVILAASALTLFVMFFGFGGVFSIHAAMRDSKRSRLDELEDWLFRNKLKQEPADSSQEEECIKEIRDLQEWPLDVPTTLGIFSGIVLPVMLSVGSTLASYVATLFQR
jgi:hypothetical protein